MLLQSESLFNTEWLLSLLENVRQEGFTVQDGLYEDVQRRLDLPRVDPGLWCRTSQVQLGEEWESAREGVLGGLGLPQPYRCCYITSDDFR